MPVYQIYFPDEVSADLQRIADGSGITVKEYIQAAVGTALSDSLGKPGKESKKRESKKN